MTKGNQLSLTVSVSPLRLQFQRTIYRIFTLVSEGKSFSLPFKCFHFCLFASCDPEFGQIYPVSLKIPFSFRTLQFDGRHFENEPGHASRRPIKTRTFKYSRKLSKLHDFSIKTIILLSMKFISLSCFNNLVVAVRIK